MYQKLLQLEDIGKQISSILDGNNVHIVFHHGRFYIVHCEHRHNGSTSVIRSEFYQEKIINGNGIKIKPFPLLEDIPFE
jgi:hypothetical protein